MSFGPSIDPSAIANQQMGYNTQAAQQQQRTNMINQQTPLGSLTYASDPNAPGGYSANVALSPQQQQLLNLQKQAQTTTGQAGVGAAGDIAGLFSGGIDLSPDAVMNKAMGYQQSYWNPIFQMQQRQQDAQLANQGITPGSAAYDQAQNLLARNQGDITNQFMMSMLPTAQNMMVQQYAAPLDLEKQLLGLSAPTNPNFQQTPTAQIQPPNYTGTALAQAQLQQQQFQNMMGGLGSLGGSILGGPIGAGIGGMFGGGWG